MPSAHYDILSGGDVERIHRGALKVLAEVGVRVESQKLLGLLGDFGGAVDLASSRVRR
jgi:trimethylamine:corrinoid methyltransferase-like protein